MFRALSRIALNPFFQAFIVAMLVILLVPTGINKYIAEQVELTTRFDGGQFIYADLDHDGISERINTFYNLSGNVGIALNKDINTLGQWNFRGKYEQGSPRIMIGDYDHDKSDEIYIFTLVGDSIMLHGLEYSLSPTFFLTHRFICQLGKSLKDPDFMLNAGSVTDMTGDGFAEVVFAVSGGHSRTPRNVFAYDVKNDTLLASPQSGAFISAIQLVDIDLDSLPEVLLNTDAAANYNDLPVEYSDTSSWFMVLDNNLDFLFKPVEFPGPSGGMKLGTMRLKSGRKVIIGNVSYGYPLINKKKWFIANAKGNILKEAELDVKDPAALISLYPTPAGFLDNTAFCVKEKGGFYLVDSNLEIVKISNVLSATRRPMFLDIDIDGKDEIIVLDPDNEHHVIYRNDISNPVILDFPIQPYLPVISVNLNGDKPPQLSLQGDQVWKLYNYGINPIYRFRVPIYLGIYLSILGFIMLIRWLYSFQIKKRYETEQKIARMQLAGVKAQIEPHFIMNTINTIGSSIYRKKSEEAYSQVLNFSNMVRSLLISSDKLTRTIQEEIDFVRNYLELEKSRFGERLEFAIQVAEDVSPDAIIPKMIIQIHVENALKHGLLPKEQGGSLDISVTKDQEDIRITITDNGIGRQQAAVNVSQSTGRGMRILAQLFETYNKHNKLPLRQEIVDLFDRDGNSCGTQVKIWVPVNFNENIY